MTAALAAVWLVHGLYNKLLGGSPRHLAIVQSVPGLAGATGERVLVAVGLLEVGIAVWLLSRRAPRWCAAVQTVVLLSMNVAELKFARALLLWPAGLLPLNLAFLTLVWRAAIRGQVCKMPVAGGQVCKTPVARGQVCKTSHAGGQVCKTPVAGGQGSRTVRVRPAPTNGRFPDLTPGNGHFADLTPTVLRRHPVAIRATLRECVTLTYAVPASVLRPLLAPGLELDTMGDLGFVAVALVQTERLRPDGWPPALGGNFFLAGYRLFTRLTLRDGRTLRGLRILRSDTDSRLMALGGNLLTHYNYHRCRIQTAQSDGTLQFAIESEDGFGDLDVTVRLEDDTLPPQSPFATVRQARAFAGPLPFTFDYEHETHSIVAIEGRRTNWRPAPAGVTVARVSFFEQPAFEHCEPRLAAAFHLRDVDYHWLRGVRHAL